MSLNSNTSAENIERDEVLSSRLFSTLPVEEVNKSGENIEDMFEFENAFIEELPTFNNTQDDFEHDSIEYLAGYIAKKLNLGQNYVYEGGIGSQSSYTWVDEISQGGLRKPTDSFINKINELNNVFNLINRESILIQENYIKHHTNLSDHVDLTHDIKFLFFKTRMHFRIRALNKQNISKNVAKKVRKTCT